jgi:hypothetical protein
MSTVERATRETTAECLSELAAELTVVVLTILGLAGVSPTVLIVIAAALFCIGSFPGRVAKLSVLEPAFLYASSQDRRVRRRLEE